MNDCIISSTGFVNYFPSSERTQRAIEEAFRKFGNDIAIIDGEDDWYASKVFKVFYLLAKRFKIKIIGTFHTGISGMSYSGAVIAKTDLPKFIKMFNKEKWKIYREFPGTLGSIRIYDENEKVLKTFFSLESRKNTITDLYKRKIERTEIHNPINNFKMKKHTYMWPA